MIKKEDIKIIVVNKPSKEESERRERELCKMLSNIWKPTDTKNHLPISSCNSLNISDV